MVEEIKLGDLLESVLGEERFKELSDLRSLSIRWKDLVGEEAGRRTRPLMIMGRKLIIGAASPSWSSEMILRKSEIRKSIKEKTGMDFEDIIITIKTLYKV